MKLLFFYSYIMQNTMGGVSAWRKNINEGLDEKKEKGENCILNLF